MRTPLQFLSDNSITFEPKVVLLVLKMFRKERYIYLCNGIFEIIHMLQLIRKKQTENVYIFKDFYVIFVKKSQKNRVLLVET